MALVAAAGRADDGVVNLFIFIHEDKGEVLCPACWGRGVLPWGGATTVCVRCETCHGCGKVWRRWR